MRFLPYLLAMIGLALPGVATAAMQDFEDAFGRTMRAELVSHTGADSDTVKIKKKDGKEFDVKLSVFSEKDQTRIRKWMKGTPPTISYAFRIEATKQKSGTASSTAYDVRVTNLARDPVEGIMVKTRSIYEYYYVPSSSGFYGYGGRLVGLEEKFDIPGQMKFNKTAKFSTRERYNLVGVFVRVFNSEGDMVAEEKLGSTKLRKLSWEDGKRRAASESSSSLRPTGGGKTTIELED